MKDVLIALAGNQNCGKTTLFNRLTGSNQHVGNFPGVTVEKKMGQIKSFKEAALVDLPGIYSLSPYTSEEVVTRDFILKDDPDLIINIVDATNIERNLYLSLQLMELQKPMVIALNMMDEVTASGNSIDVHTLSEHLRCPIVPISASKNEGIDELIRVVYGSLTAAGPDDPTLLTVSTFLKYGGSLETCAKELNVHPNTIRYRLKRAAESTGWDATDPREAYVLITAIALGRMATAQ